jgi:segregation and condensation protein B
VSSNIVKTLLEREWVRVVGHKDVPGRPAMYATTRRFLDYFNLKNLEDLPTLAEIRDLDTMNEELALEGVDTPDPEQVAAGSEQIDDIDDSSQESDDEVNADDATVEMEFISELDDSANDEVSEDAVVEGEAVDVEADDTDFEAEPESLEVDRDIIDETKASDESDIIA